MGSLTLTVTMLRFISTFLLLLSPALSQRPLSPGRNPLMSGRFIYRAQPEEEQMWINYFNILDIPLTEELLAQDSYKTTFSLSKDGKRMSIDFDGEFSQELKFGQEVISTEPFSGLKMKTVAWRTGANSFSQTSRVEEAGITETVSYVFYPSGAQVNTKMARPSQNQEARLTEWYERLQ